MPESTVAALTQLEEILMSGGIISVHCYLGQDGGEEEAASVSGWMARLPWEDWRVARYEIYNKASNREFLFLAQKM
jgi:hypothetical protein